MTKKKNAKRNVKPPGEVRSETVHVRLTPNQWEALSKEAKRRGIKPSVLVQRRAIRAKDSRNVVPPAPDLTLLDAVCWAANECAEINASLAGAIEASRAPTLQAHLVSTQSDLKRILRTLEMVQPKS